MINDFDLYNEIGTKIKKKRKSLGITQDKLAELTNYSPSFIANIESKTFQTFSISALNNIAKALNTNMINLLPSATKMKSLANKIKCNNCKYEVNIPEELVKLINCVEEITNKNIKLTCPLCHKKII